MDRETRRALLWTIVLVIVAVLVGVAIWGIQIATSDVRGRGNSVIKKNDANNRIQAQEAYVGAYNEVKRADRQLDILAASRKQSNAAETRYVGAVSYCQSVVADYNALGQKYRSADFLPAGFPLVIDENDPTTDCKEN